MYKMTIILLSFIFYFQIIPGKAQSKYALLIGVNEYYEKPGVTGGHSLKGCVNDAISMQSLLLNRFGFAQTNITTLLNARATQENMTVALQNILQKGKAGDAVVFYFCGHGIYMKNPANLSDTLKKGYNQALCMSNLYAANLDCLVKDNTLKKWFNQFVGKKMILTALFDCCFSGQLAQAPSREYLTFTPPATTDKSIVFEAVDSASRSFNMTETPIIADYSRIPRPSETPNSKFASISACTDNEIALEIYDESGVPHGAFTKTLLDIYEKNNSDLPLAQVLQEITLQMNDLQQYVQKPTYYYDTQRTQTNLIGLPVGTGAAKPYVATCIRYANKTVTLNAGWNDGLARGNAFSNKAKKLSFRLTRIYADSALGVIIGNTVVGKGDRFELSDHYRSSDPFIKIYVPELNMSTEAFLPVFNKQILPLTKSTKYIDYYTSASKSESFNYVFTNKPDEAKAFSTIPKDLHYSIVFPLPSDIAVAVRKKLATDQNVRLVNAPEAADVLLYLNYAVVSPFHEQPSFVFTYRPPSNGAVSAIGGPTFFMPNLSVDKLQTSQKALNMLTAGIQAITRELTRGKTTWWLNGYARK
jgi:hypothetical protein